MDTTKRINDLVRAISIIESEINKLKRVSELEKSRDELKALLLETNQQLVIVDNIEATIVERKGRLKFDEEKARDLLHPETFNAIFSESKPSIALSVKVK